MNSNIPLFVSAFDHFFKRLTIILFLSLSGIAAFAQTPAFYNNNVNSPSNSFPFNVAAGKETQYLALPGEFPGAYNGLITKLYVQGTPSVSGSWTTLTIKLGQSNITVLPSGTIYTGPLTTVLSASTYSASSTAAGWMMFNLQVPFAYDPTKSMIIDISQCASTGGGFTVTNSSVSTIRRTYINAASCSFSYGGQDANMFNCGIDLISAAYNDAGVLSIDSPTTFCGGAQNVYATIKNYGKNQINSVNVNWSLNGTLQTPVSYTNMLDTMGVANNTAKIFLGNYGFPFSTNIKAWTSEPNGVADTANMNDTVYATKAPALSGSYTINPAGSGAYNFTSFTALANALNYSGICGPVSVTVAPGTYNEQISLTNIFGSSATNTIVIDGVDTTTRILTASTSGNPAVIQLNGTRYVTIKNLNIINTNTTQNTAGYYGVQLTNGAHYNNILGCKITVPIYGTGPGLYPVALAICGSTYSTTGDNGNYNTIDGNRMIGGYYGMSIQGVATAPTTSTGNRITNNKVEMAYYMGIYVYYQANLILDHNTVNNGPYYTNDYGIYTYYLSNSDITRNTVNASYSGIYLYTYTSYNPGTINVTNNMINSQGGGTTFYGLYINNSNNAIISHNTVVNGKAAGAAFYCFISYSGNRINNNIFMVTQPGATALYIGNVSTTYFLSLDYNNIVSTVGNANLIYWAGTYYPTLPSLKAANASFNQNNSGATPIFESATNLHLTTTMEMARGVSGLGINIDIDGQSRCTFAPNYGADESNYVPPTLVAGFTVGPVYLNSPINFINNFSAASPMTHRWYVDGIFVSSGVNLTTSFNTLGAHNVSIRSTGCAGTDSTNVVITVLNQTNAPGSDFVATPGVVNTGQNVNLIDMSTNGPTAWQWTISPGILNTDYYFVSGTNATSRNPIVYFNTSGSYTICMRASNVIGAGVNKCKTNYITVKVAQSMCMAPFTTKLSIGNLYSSGGPAGGYGQNENCFFVIDGCADSTFLNVTSASFGSGTTDRFEVYEGDYVAGQTPVAQFTGGTTYNNLPLLIKVKGKMTVREVTDATLNNGQGIVANWFTTAGSFAAPTGTILGSADAYYCAGGLYNYYSSSFRDPAYTYEWDFDNDGLLDMTGMDGFFSFAATGTDTIKLKISGCGGTVVLTKFVNIISPPAPVAAFSTTSFIATNIDTVQLNDVSAGGVSTWKWTITGPGPVTYVGGTNSTSRSPRVMCVIPGNYDVKLRVTNCAGTDSASISSYFKILAYCTPTAGFLLPDLSISKVKLGSINNTIISPAPGTVAYRDFTQTSFSYADRGAAYPFTITRAANNNNAGIKIWVDWNQDGTFDPTNELVASTITGNISWNSVMNVPKSAVLGATRMRIGVAFNNLSNTPCGANMFGEFQDYRLIVREDVTPPVITFGDGNIASLEIGRSLVEKGDSAVDAVDGILTDSITYSGFLSGRGFQMPITQQATALGTFTLKATVYDVNQNMSEKVKTITVTPDTTRPTINLTGTNPSYLEVYTSYTEPGVDATDFYFTAPLQVSSVNNIDTATLGTYQVTYNATDINGNNAITVVRNVIVRDSQKPVLKLAAGTDTIYVEIGTNYNDPSTSVTDNYDLSPIINRTGNVNTFIPGTYYLIYSATDGSGNISSPVTRVVIVRDGTAPELILAAPFDPDTMYIEVKKYQSVPEPGYTAVDNYYPTSQLSISKSGSVDLNKIGVYVVTYIATDPIGNSSAPKRRIYKVIDSTKPVITLNGSNTVNICRWRQYSELGATVTDNYWNGLQVEIVSNVNMSIPGTYVVTYNAKDSSGNIANTEQRLVNVLDFNSSTCWAFTGINKGSIENKLKITPNPSNGLLFVEIEILAGTRGDVLVYNSLGQLVKEVSLNDILNNSFTVDLRNEPSGVYFISVKNATTTLVQKFVINK